MEKKRIPLQIKSLQNREFEGYGSIFGNTDLGGDVVAKGAFTRSLKKYGGNGSLPLMFWAHDPAQVPGKWLEMSEDTNGLYVKGMLADTQLGNEVRTLLGMGAVRGLSIGYQTVDQDYTKDGVRVIKDAELWEVSVVSLPMNPLATVEHVKSRLSASGEYVPTVREFEHYFREIGCSKNVARKLISKIFDDDLIGETPIEAGGTPDVEDETELVAKTLQEIRGDSLDREVSKVEPDPELIGSLKDLEENLTAINLQRRWRRFAA